MTRTFSYTDIFQAIDHATELFGEHPDPIGIHHCLYLLYRARGLASPSFDDLMVTLRGLV